MTSVIFFGSDQYSAIVLVQLLTSNYQILSVITDQKKYPTPVEKLAIEHNRKVAYYPDFDHSLITKDTLGLCASFDHLIPRNIIELFAGNLYNLHPSLLPQYRNVSPVQYAIALGDKETGITLFRIAPTIDDGEIISQVSQPILPTDTTPSLTTRLFAKGAELLLQGYEPCKQTINKVRNLVFTHRLKGTLQHHLPAGYKAFIFGSRAQGTSRSYSDVDLGILGKDKLPTSKIASIKNELEDTNLPYRVDLIDFTTVTDKFKNSAMRKVVNL